MRNSKPIPYQYLLIAMLPALLLTACGGGGSATQNTINTGGVTPEDCVTVPGTPNVCSNPPDNNAGGGGTVGDANLIDTSNAAEVTNFVLGIIDIFYNLGERQGVGGNIITAAQNTSETEPFSLAEFAFGQLAYMAELDSLSLLDTSMVVGIDGPELVPCTTGDVVNQSVDTTIIIAEFTECVNNGTTLNGLLTISEFDVDQNVNVIGAAWQMTALFAFNGGLTISDDTGTIVIQSGEMRFSASADASSSGGGSILVASPLSISLNGQTETIQNGFILDYNFDLNSSSATTLSVNGSLNRSGSSVSNLTIFTQQDLRRFSAPNLGAGPPGPYDSGRLRISSGGSNVTLDILTSTEVRLDLNDGAATTNMSWEDLLNS